MAKRKLDLDMLHSHYVEDMALEAWQKGDGELFASCGYANGSGLLLVSANAEALRERGMYEAAMLEAYTGCKIDNRRWTQGVLKAMFDYGDRQKFQAMGSPIPETLTVYRGVYRHGRQRQTRGFSWTTSLNVACWYALRGLCKDPEPAVYQAMARKSEVICYYNGRNEREVICLPKRLQKLEISIEEMKATARLEREEVT
jgi:hypothetical protein